MYHIAYITDENYVLPTKVSIASLIDAVGEAEVTVHVLLDDISQTSRRQLLDLQTANVRMRLVDNLPSLDGINATHAYISKATFFKVFLCDLVKDADRLLYIDGDTLVFPGVLSIFETDISNAYAAAVPDMGGMLTFHDHVKLGILRYFNAGVMLLNMAKLRSDDMPRRLLQDCLARHDARFMDQDSFNAVLGNDVVYLGLKYNRLDYESLYSTRQILDFFCAGEEELSSPVILHYAGASKPWKTPKAMRIHDWLKWVGDEDFIRISRSFFESMAKDIQGKAPKFTGSVARPYHIGLDMLQTSTDGVGIDGFFNEEPWGRWCGSDASIQISGDDLMRASGDLALRVKVRAFHGEKQLRLTFNGTTLCNVAVPCDKSLVLDFAIEQKVVKKVNVLAITSEGEPISPKQLGMNQDFRPLSLGFYFIRIVETLGNRFASGEQAQKSQSAELDAHGAIIAEMRKSIDDAHAGLRRALGEIEAIRNSPWFKLGRALAFVPRKLRAIFTKLLGAS